ncbi:hypothetical protein ABXT21_12240 [Ralstonia sp. SM1864_UCD524_TZ4]|uniref:Peptidase C39-like domain-containing protein n=1 Tax=Ralstonia solanacearum TaxID=305 RepID=A0A0S4UPB3_RALSL|nr:hypothetical protein [Ralstonia pseudosolanacearum]CUV24062.1 conserved protein of unknown function [Ralstonia solanacearum]CUV36070.1 conserved protein of unknown function [Ralstonia solanacearum]CUV38848.1 conserved protein of unknown function [Ralstonia solanacearum]CUV63897.1 conserved protein of unknown function [Ralstonia solanacearum]
MNALIQTLHPALRLGRQLVLADSGVPVFSRQGEWDGGSPLHCAAMALALLGRLSNPAEVSRCRDGPEADFWDRAWPHYLHGLTLSELASLFWELNCGVRPVMAEGKSATVLRFCTRELAKGWPVIVGCRSGQRAHAVLAVGIEGRQHKRGFMPHALLTLDPAEVAPGLASCNARLEFGRAGRRPSYVTASATHPVTFEGAVSIRLPRPAQSP